MSLPTPEGYERVESPYGGYWRRIGFDDPEFDAFVSSDMAWLSTRLHRLMVRCLGWTEGLDTWLHERDWTIGPICCTADWCYGAPVAPLRHWLSVSWPGRRGAE